MPMEFILQKGKGGVEKLPIMKTDSTLVVTVGGCKDVCIVIRPGWKLLHKPEMRYLVKFLLG